MRCFHISYARLERSLIIGITSAAVDCGVAVRARVGIGITSPSSIGASGIPLSGSTGAGLGNKFLYFSAHASLDIL